MALMHSKQPYTQKQKFDWRECVTYSPTMQKFIIWNTQLFITDQINNKNLYSLRKIRKFVGKVVQYLYVYEIHGRLTSHHNTRYWFEKQQLQPLTKKQLMQKLYNELPAVQKLKEIIKKQKIDIKNTSAPQKQMIFLKCISKTK